MVFKHFAALHAEFTDGINILSSSSSGPSASFSSSNPWRQLVTQYVVVVVGVDLVDYVGPVLDGAHSENVDEVWVEQSSRIWTTSMTN